MPDRIEQRLIDRFVARSHGHFIGDDCAVWREHNMLVTTDQMVEGVHFDFSLISPKDTGWRLMAANASDILSMGGRPTHYLCNMAVPAERIGEAEGIIDGISRFASEKGIVLLGGDTTKADRFFLAVTMMGQPGSRLWKRSGARPGDSVAIADYPGLSLAGYYCLTAGLKHLMPDAAQRFSTPDPYAVMPKHTDAVTAAIDISDSLLSESRIVAEQSGVSVEIVVDDIPVHPAVAEASERFSLSLPHLLLGSGEEFFLLTTLSEPTEGWHIIGCVTEKRSEPVRLLWQGELLSPDTITTYSHFES